MLEPKARTAKQEEMEFHTEIVDGVKKVPSSSKTPLTKNEKITLTLSSLAVLIAIFFPYITWKFFQNSVREQQLRANALSPSAWVEVDADVTRLEDVKFYYVVHLKNTGPLPLSRVALECLHVNKWKANIGGIGTLESKDFVTSPPNLLALKKSEEAIFVLLDGPLQPEHEMEIRFPIKSQYTVHRFDRATDEHGSFFYTDSGVCITIPFRSKGKQGELFAYVDCPAVSASSEASVQYFGWGVKFPTTLPIEFY